MILNKIRRVAEEKPRRIAYRVGGEQITYGELWQRADCYADLLSR